MGKKADQKKKDKIVDDKTFGLKNKNRSAKVQAYVQQVKQSVDQRNPQERKSQAELAARRSAKEEKRAREAELALLFNDVDQQQRKKKEDEAASDSGADDQFMCEPEEYLFRPEDFDDVAQDDDRLEERLEAEREKLRDRTDLTPVTEASFQAWKQRKREEAAEKEAARVRRAKSGDGKLRGWDLWKMDKDLFVDDENADEFYEREALEGLEEGDSETEAAFDLS
ncbi:hypothetical protein NESM_000380900 [Novymonas esmeraldas]|uniref:ZC3H15/TMA46 family C-terminal domain-containing protein n=1 Tax=Novymonas esmeraldas TaxID=1808958 RepID=A0AAW0EKD1_9TRYP